MRIVCKLALVGLLLSSVTALAGRGSSTAALKAAVASGSEDAIVGEIERAETLACLSCIEVVHALIDHDSQRVRDAAGWWLGRRGVRDEVLDTMTARLVAQDPQAARNAADVLGGMRDPQVLSALTAYVQKPLDEQSGVAAAHALGLIGHPSAMPALQNASKGALPLVRAAAVAAMRELRAPIGQKAAAKADALIGLLSDSDAGVRREAVYTIGNAQDRAGVQALISVLQNDPSAPVRKAAAWALGEIGDGAANGPLAAARNDSDAFVRSVAAGALGRLK